MKCLNVLALVLVLVVTMATCGGCAFHTQTSMGAGNEASYAASMSRGHGVGIDYGPGPLYAAHSDQRRDTPTVYKSYAGAGNADCSARD